MGNAAKPLTGREYKLLLKPGAFRDAPRGDLAEKFWAADLAPIINDSLGWRNSGRSRAEKALKLKKRRVVQYFDTKDRLLRDNGFALRRRIRLRDGEPDDEPEVTLKLRTSDILLASEFADRADLSDDDKFEEDIAPLQIGTETGRSRTIRSGRRDTYSRFSVSLKRSFEKELETLAVPLDRFKAFEGELEDAIGGKVNGERKLRAGPTVLEWVFQHAKVDLGSVRAEFGFTLWYFAGGASPDHWQQTANGAIDPAIVEISFDYETEDGRVDAEVSRRAVRLFHAMQLALPVNRRATSKTALAQPQPKAAIAG